MACLHSRFTRLLPLFLALLQFARTSAAIDPQTNPWRAHSGAAPMLQSSDAWVQPDSFLAFDADHSALEDILKAAPREGAAILATSKTTITLPLPDGTFSNFRFLETAVMAPELAAKFPKIRTFLGQGVADPSITVRFDLTPVGFHAQILSPNGASYIEPWLRGNTNLHVCYFKQGYRTAAKDFQCFALSDETKTAAKSCIYSGAFFYRRNRPIAALQGWQDHPPLKVHLTFSGGF